MLLHVDELNESVVSPLMPEIEDMQSTDFSLRPRTVFELNVNRCIGEFLGQFNFEVGFGTIQRTSVDAQGRCVLRWTKERFRQRED